MSLPAFTANGLLPEGVHPNTEEELKERCVDPFYLSNTRKDIFDGLCSYRGELASLGVCSTQWINGSFVDETRRNPEDVDLVNFCDQGRLNSLPSASKSRVLEIIGAGEKTVPTHKCHSFLVIEYPAGHPMAATFEQKRRYWREWFAMPQEYTRTDKFPAPHRGQKGFVSMTVGNSSEAPTISTAL